MHVRGQGGKPYILGGKEFSEWFDDKSASFPTSIISRGIKKAQYLLIAYESHSQHIQTDTTLQHQPLLHENLHRVRKWRTDQTL